VNIHRLQVVVTLVFLSFSVQALGQTLGIDCEPLKPVPPQDTSTEITGKLDTNISGALLKKLADPKVAVEGTYRDVTNNVLKEFPNADQVYIKEKTLFLYCQILRDNKGISDTEKLDRVERLMGIKEKVSEDSSPAPADARRAFLLGTWEAQIPGNYYHMRVSWNQEVQWYEGILALQGEASENVGFILGEPVWRAVPRGNPVIMREEQKWRSGSNGLSTNVWWSSGTVYLDKSSQDELVTSTAIFRRVLP
jgi:hypothetical protein